MESPGLLRPSVFAVATCAGLHAIRLLTRVTLTFSISVTSLRLNFFCTLATKSSYLFCGLELTKTLEGSLNYVGGIRGAKALSTNVLYACECENGTNRTACDNTGTGSCGLKKNLTCTVLTDYFVGYCLTVQRNGYHIFLCIFNSLADSVGNLCCFTEAVAYMSISVAYYHDSCKTSDTSALYGLGNTV